MFNLIRDFDDFSSVCHFGGRSFLLLECLIQSEILMILMICFQFATLAGEQRQRNTTQKIILGLSSKDLRLFIALFN